MKKATFVPGLVFGCTATCAWAQQPSGAAREEAAPPREGSEITAVPARVSARAAEDMLRRRVESVDWTDKTFEEVLDWLRDQSERRVNLVPRWGPLGVENVNRESLVTLQLNNTTVADVLNETLAQLSEDGEVQYRGEANKLTISTRQDFERKLYTKAYDVTDIMFRVPDFGKNAPQIDLKRTSQSRGGSGGGGGGGGGGQGVFGGGSGGQSQDEEESGQQAEQQIEQRLAKLRDLIQRSIAPETWDLTGQQGAPNVPGTGGAKGRIEIFNRALVVTNTIEVHEMIAGRFSYGD